MPTYQSQVLDHLGLVAGMFNELRISEGWIGRPAGTSCALYLLKFGYNGMDPPSGKHGLGEAMIGRIATIQPRGRVSYAGYNIRTRCIKERLSTPWCRLKGFHLPSSQSDRRRITRSSVNFKRAYQIAINE